MTWSRPVAPMRPVDLSQTPTMVPTAQLLSTMELPSRGSQQRTYWPSGSVFTISGSSSDEASQTSLLLLARSQRRSSAMTSTVSCLSPNAFDASFTVTKFTRNASVILTHASRSSFTMPCNFGSLRLFAMTSSMGASSCLWPAPFLLWCGIGSGASGSDPLEPLCKSLSPSSASPSTASGSEGSPRQRLLRGRLPARGTPASSNSPAASSAPRSSLRRPEESSPPARLNAVIPSSWPE
mmetsp:Transcript_96442/g.300326  ORF Transcript_96442/g.300326 Transcript_96442/m.300326 type:complete len:238 (-) Transcript_96442:135-848(-)